jgi:chromosome segregation ATPase
MESIIYDGMNWRFQLKQFRTEIDLCKIDNIKLKKENEALKNRIEFMQKENEALKKDNSANNIKVDVIYENASDDNAVAKYKTAQCLLSGMKNLYIDVVDKNIILTKNNEWLNEQVATSKNISKQFDITRSSYSQYIKQLEIKLSIIQQVRDMINEQKMQIEALYARDNKFETENIWLKHQVYQLEKHIDYEKFTVRNLENEKQQLKKELDETEMKKSYQGAELDLKNTLLRKRLEQLEQCDIKIKEFEEIINAQKIVIRSDNEISNLKTQLETLHKVIQTTQFLNIELHNRLNSVQQVAPIIPPVVNTTPASITVANPTPVANTTPVPEPRDASGLTAAQRKYCTDRGLF